MKGQRIKLKEGHKFIIKLTISFLQPFFLFLIGLLVNFAIFYLIFRSPYLNRFPPFANPVEYESILIQIGYYEPIPVQLQKYIINFFTGNWGTSYVAADSIPVTEVMRQSIPDTIEIMLLPLIIGLGGFRLGKMWSRRKNKIVGKFMTLFIAMGVAMPLIFFGSTMQYLFANFTNLPVAGRSSVLLPNPPDITGFPLFDSMISGNWDLAFDFILHSIIPWLVLSIVITSLVLKQARTKIESDPRKNSIVSNSFIAGKMFGFLFLIMVVIEMIFNLRGFGWYFIASIFSGDPLVINGCIFIIIISFAFTILFANIITITMDFLKKRKLKEGNQSKAEEIGEKNKEKGRKKIHFKNEMKSYIKTSLKNPFTIIGGCLILILVFVSILHPILGTYPLEEITIPYIPFFAPYSPPSPTHPLGTTIYGYDVLARVLYGTQGAFLFGIVVVLIGLAGGSIFGTLAGKFHRYVYSGIIGPMIIFFLFPSFLLLVLLIPIFPNFDYRAVTVIIGIMQIPIFSRIIANAIRRENNYIDIAKSIIKYIPLEVAFAIILYQTLGFMGFSDSQVPQLGETLNWGRGHISAIWANMWPGIFLFLIMLGLILLHEGLQAPVPHKPIADIRSETTIIEKH